MKRIGIFFLFCLCGLCVLQAQSLTGRKVYAFVKEGKLKSSTGFFAGTIGTFAYGDEFTVLAEDGSWVQVRGANNVTGWTPASSVTTRQIINTGSRTSASAEELALAGKAFSSETEQASQGASQADYADVDLMENIVIPDEEVLRFIQDGRLNTGEKK